MYESCVPSFLRAMYRLENVSQNSDSVWTRPLGGASVMMWDELHSRDGFYDSHSPMLPRYRAMMSAVKRMAPGSLRDLTAQELKEVLKLGDEAE